jgi:hypothetical protein
VQEESHCLAFGDRSVGIQVHTETLYQELVTQSIVVGGRGGGVNMKWSIQAFLLRCCDISLGKCSATFRRMVVPSFSGSST